MTTQTTTYQYSTNCPNHNLDSPEQIVGSEVILNIQSTKKCTNNHDSHLFYGEKEWIRVAELAVPADNFTIVFGWRTSTQETINISPTANVSSVDDSVKKHTRLKFTVPAAGQPATIWEISGGSPGFKLTVRVKRKT